MTYLRHTVHLTTTQLEKLRAAANKKQAVTLEIDPTVRGNHHLYLTETQIKKLNKGKSARLTLSKTQLTKNGGFIITIPTLLAGLGAAAGIASAAAATAKAVNAKKHETKMESEAKRHNKTVESFLGSKKGQGLLGDIIQLAPLANQLAPLANQMLNPKPKKGKGAFLPKKK